MKTEVREAKQVQSFTLPVTQLNAIRKKVLELQIKTGKKVTQSALVAKILAKAGYK